MWNRISRVAGTVMVVAVMFALVGGTETSTARADTNSCNCVLYVRSQTGLPGGPATAAGYTEGVMRGFGYRRVTPQAGAIFVWDAYQKGAGSSGHMAIITSARYDNPTKTWQISVRHANWGGCGIRDTSFKWGDLYGVNAYIR